MHSTCHTSMQQHMIQAQELQQPAAADCCCCVYQGSLLHCAGTGCVLACHTTALCTLVKVVGGCNWLVGDRQVTCHVCSAYLRILAQACMQMLVTPCCGELSVSLQFTCAHRSCCCHHHQQSCYPSNHSLRYMGGCAINAIAAAAVV